MLRGIAEVTPWLYIGSGQSAGNRREVLSRQISCIVNATRDVPRQNWDFAEVLRIPVSDVPSASILPYFDQVADLIESNSMRGRRTLVHCNAGISRSSSLCIAYLMKYHRMSLRSAHDHVRSRRPIIRPNTGFWQQLIDYEYMLRGRNSIEMRLSPVGPVPDIYYNQVKDMLLLR